MVTRLAVPLCIACSLVGFQVARAEEHRPTAAQVEFFEKTVRPLLADHCFQCHGPMKQKAGLRVDSRASMMHGGDSGATIVPGHPEQSLLIKAIEYNDEPRMPPKGKLSADKIAALKKWIEQGAVWPEAVASVRPITPTKGRVITAEDRTFWSFQPVADPPLPMVRDRQWPRTSIDYFVLAKLEANGLRPSEQADKRTLLRRVTFDLIGLPPTPEEIDAFLNDNRPDAFARVVDRLLNSPQYGERWARHWLDIARYGEDQAHTFQAKKYPNGFRYRDWLIRAFNTDLPYDQFIREQLAADLLDEPNRLERLPALGFFALGPVYYGDPKKLDQMDDRIDTLSRGFLGLTVACARCHDHKFDPITQKDYYALAGVFASTEYREVPLVPPEVVAQAKAKAKDKGPKKNAPPPYPYIDALADAAKPINMNVLIRGNPSTPGEPVSRRFLSVLDSDQHAFAHGSGRLELANDIASPENPLTARVMVNRIWQHHFGKGLVRTPSNFGHLGEPPTHPELLDHLATRFIQSGWSIKALHRDIVLSATYQQASHSNGEGDAVDPENKLLGRMNRRRLEVEAWRDAMLAVADTLDRKIGGPSLDLADANNRRRTLYGSVSRHELDSLLRLFDFPDANITSAERTATTVPLQQLFVLNSEFMAANARALAAKVTARKHRNPADCVRAAFLRLYARPVTDAELRLALAYLSRPSNSTGMTRWEEYAQVLLSANEFMYVD